MCSLSYWLSLLTAVDHGLPCQSSSTQTHTVISTSQATKIREVPRNAPIKAYEWDIYHVTAFAFFFEMPQNLTHSFLFFSRFTIDQVIFPQNVPLFYVRKPWNAPFPHLILKLGKWGFSRFSEINKVEHFGGKHVTSNRKGPKMESIDFGAFQGKLQMPSHDNFHRTSRNWNKFLSV